MNIAYFSNSVIPSPSANSLHIMKMCQAFSQNKNTVILYTFDDKTNNDDVRKINVYTYYNVESCFDIKQFSLVTIDGSRLRYIYTVFQQIIKTAYIVICSRNTIVYGRSLVSCLVAALMGKPVIFESHFPVWYGVLERYMFNILIRLPTFKRLVVITAALRHEYSSRYDNCKIEFIVAPDAADEVSINMNDCSVLNGSKNLLKVGYVGHLYKGKGIEIIEQIAPQLPDIEFHIIGGLKEDVRRWRSIIHANNVYFYGHINQKNLSKYINNLDICLLPNQYLTYAFGSSSTNRPQNISNYTSPLKMFEYMAHNKPIIASDLPVLREVLDEETALLVLPDDIEGWVSAIKKMECREHRMMLANNAHKLFLQKYTWKERARRVLDGV
jgi:glycosyltransferase involved in cell wall biosynthesis|tara:strand:- start:1505 stop:2656 length:1152 start_codon:yes stop_codon:yes gene_type:complete